VTFRRPELAAVQLVGRAPFFRSWAASIRHIPLDGRRNEVVYTLTFRCRPTLLAPLLELGGAGATRAAVQAEESLLRRAYPFHGIPAQGRVCPTRG